MPPHLLPQACMEENPSPGCLAPRWVGLRSCKSLPFASLPQPKEEGQSSCPPPGSLAVTPVSWAGWAELGVLLYLAHSSHLPLPAPAPAQEHIDEA